MKRCKLVLQFWGATLNAHITHYMQLFVLVFQASLLGLHPKERLQLANELILLNNMNKKMGHHPSIRYITMKVPKKHAQKNVFLQQLVAATTVFNPSCPKTAIVSSQTWPHGPDGSSHAWISKTVEKLEKAKKINKNIPPFSNLTKGGVVQLCTPIFCSVLFFFGASQSERSVQNFDKTNTQQNKTHQILWEVRLTFCLVPCCACCARRDASDSPGLGKLVMQRVEAPWNSGSRWLQDQQKHEQPNTPKTNKKPYKSTQKQHTNNKQNNEKTRNFVPSTCPKKWNNKTIGQPSSAVTSSSSKKFPKHFHLA